MAGFSEIFSLRAVVEVITGDAERKLDAVEKKGRSLGSTFTSSFKAASTSILAFVGASSAISAVGNAISGAIGAATKFESGVRNLNVILKLSEQELTRYVDGIRTLGTELGINVSATQAVAAAYDVAQAGFTKAAENALVMEAALKAASASGVDASLAANLIASTLRAYGKDASEAAKVSDIYFKAVEAGIMTFEQLATSIGPVNAVAAQAGISLEEVAASMAAATNQGIRASTAADGVRGAMVNLLAPSEQAKKIMAEYGLEINENTLRQKGLSATLKEIYVTTNGSAAAMRGILGDVQAFSVAAALAGKDGVIMAEALDEIGKSSGATEAALDEQRKTFAFASSQMASAFEGLGILIVSQFSKPATDAVKAVTDSIIALDGFIKGLSQGEGGLLGSLVTGFQNTFPATYTMLQQLGETLQELANLVAGWFAAFGGAEAEAASGAVDLILSSLVKIADVIGNLIGLLGEFLQAAATALGGISSLFGTVAGTIGTAWSQVVDGMKGVWENFVDGVEQLWMQALGRIIKAIQSLPGVVRNQLSGVEEGLIAQRDELNSRDRPTATVGQNLAKIAEGAKLPFRAASESAPSPPVAPATEGQVAGAKGVFDFVQGMGTLLATGELPESMVPETESGPQPVAGPTADRVTPVDPKKAAEDIEARADAIKRELELNKISLAEGAKRYQLLFAEAQKAKLGAEDLHKVEKALFKVREDMVKQSEKAQEVNDKLRVERIKIVKGETAGLLEALEIEKKERAKAGADSVELEAWYGAQRQKIFASDTKKKADEAKKVADAETKLQDTTGDLRQQTLAAEDKPLEAALAGLDQQKLETMRNLKEQRDAIIAANGDKLKAEQDYQAAILVAEQNFNAQRLKITTDAAKERAKAEQSAKSAILRNEATVESDPDKARKKELEADNADRLQQIKDQVEAYKQAGVDQLVIDRFITSEQRKIRESAKPKDEREQGEANASPLQSFDEAHGGLSSLGFSIGGKASRRRRGDPAATAAANKLASDVGALRYGGSSPPPDEGIKNVLTVRVVNEAGTELYSDTQTADNQTTDMSTTYQLGRTA